MYLMFSKMQMVFKILLLLCINYKNVGLFLNFDKNISHIHCCFERNKQFTTMSIHIHAWDTSVECLQHSTYSPFGKKIASFFRKQHLVINMLKQMFAAILKLLNDS